MQSVLAKIAPAASARGKNLGLCDDGGHVVGNYDREHPAEEPPGSLEATDDVFGALGESRPDELMAAEHRCEDEPVADPAPLTVRDESETPEVHLQLDARGRVVDADR